MATRPNTIDASKYRKIKFIGGTILQDREVQFLEDIDKDVISKGKYELGAIFEPGATLNCHPVINGTAVSLTKSIRTSPCWCLSTEPSRSSRRSPPPSAQSQPARPMQSI